MNKTLPNRMGPNAGGSGRVEDFGPLKRESYCISKCSQRLEEQISIVINHVTDSFTDMGKVGFPSWPPEGINDRHN
jgi:hypothetical protein